MKEPTNPFVQLLRQFADLGYAGGHGLQHDGSALAWDRQPAPAITVSVLAIVMLSSTGAVRPGMAQTAANDNAEG